VTQSTSSPALRKPAEEAKSDRVAQRRNRTVRLVVLTLGLVIITAIGTAHRFGVPVVGVDALCPFGGIETLWSMIVSMQLIQRIAVSSVILMSLVLVIAMLFRRSFCGYICPLGALQELFGKIGKAVFRDKRPTVPAVVDRPARYLKYVVLVVFAVWTWQAASLMIRPYDPWVAWMHLTSPELLAEFSIGAAVLAISLVGSVVYDRFFCKYLCPMGGFLGAIARISVFKVRRNENTCIDCKACDKACPVNVTVSTVAVVNDPECIDCAECINVCPVKNTLEVSTSRWPSSGKVLRPLTVLGIIVVLIAGVIGLTTATGSFAWTIPALSETVEKSGGTLNVEEIKGSMTFAEISKATGIPAAKFQERFGVKPAEMNDKIKDLAPVYGFDVHTDVRGFIAEELGQAK
jgi:polyferredoxin